MLGEQTLRASSPHRQEHCRLDVCPQPMEGPRHGAQCCKATRHGGSLCKSSGHSILRGQSSGGWVWERRRSNIERLRNFKTQAPFSAEWICDARQDERCCTAHEATILPEHRANVVGERCINGIVTQAVVQHSQRHLRARRQ